MDLGSKGLAIAVLSGCALIAARCWAREAHGLLGKSERVVAGIGAGLALDLLLFPELIPLVTGPLLVVGAVLVLGVILTLAGTLAHARHRLG